MLFAWSLAVTDATPDHEASFAANRSLWDAWTAVHAAGDFYDLEGFKAGGVRLRPYEIEMIGDVAGRSLLHLQCHFGIDTLSWARLGARVTGADLSPAAVELARSLADELGFPDARFVAVEPVRPAGGPRRRLRHRLHLARRARLAARHPAAGRGSWRTSWLPAARFFITEIHPVVQAFADEGVGPGELRLRYPYWEHREPLIFEVKGSYADRDADVGEQTEHGWDHGLGEIVTALIDAGLRIETLVEHPFLDWQLDFLVEDDEVEGMWRCRPTPAARCR